MSKQYENAAPSVRSSFCDLHTFDFKVGFVDTLDKALLLFCTLSIHFKIKMENTSTKVKLNKENYSRFV